jgi:glycosyltransferase involved in cell wall biosynthesis
MIHASGIGTYLRNIVPLVIRSKPDYRFILLGKTASLAREDWVNAKNINIIDFQSPIYSINEQWEFFKTIPQKTHLFWSPNFNIPLSYKGKLLVTVHDLFHLAMPHLVKGKIKQLYARLMFTRIRCLAKAIITNSVFTKNELIRITGPGTNIYPIYMGLADSWYATEQNENPVNKPFLLYVGNVKPHKNLRCLIKAFKILMNDIPHDLVIVGKKEGFITGDPSITNLSPSLSERVHFNGYVDDNLLKRYYSFADVFIFPSLYEGFGFPPLEAMACSCPVIVSNAASLPEICGDAAIFCNPHDAKDLANKIKMIIDNPTLREKMKQKGINRAKRFNWQDTTEQTVAVMEKIIN